MRHSSIVFRSLPWRKPATQLKATAKLRLALNSKATILGVALVLLYLVRVSVLSLWVGPVRPVLELGGQVILLVASVFLVAKGVRKFSWAGVVYIALTLPGVLMAESIPQSFMKWAGWIILFVVVGPVLQSAQARVLRQAAWDTFKIAFTVISIASFFWYLLSLPNFGRGIFTGVMTHSMLVGPIAGMALLFCAHSALLKRSYFSISLIFLPLAPCLLSGSRSAVLALIAGIAVLTGLMISRSGLKKGKTFIILIVVVGLLGVFFHEKIQNSYIFFTYTASLQEKGLENSREKLWQARLDEFIASPVFGVGIGMGEGDEEAGIVKSGTGNISIEPGSSYLAILSMTGVAGALGFLSVIASVFVLRRKINRKMFFSNPLHVELFTIVTFLFICMITEGWVYAVGNPFCLLFWLCLGRGYDLMSIKTPGAKVSQGKVLTAC